VLGDRPRSKPLCSVWYRSGSPYSELGCVWILCRPDSWSGAGVALADVPATGARARARRRGPADVAPAEYRRVRTVVSSGSLGSGQSTPRARAYLLPLVVCATSGCVKAVSAADGKEKDLGATEACAPSVLARRSAGRARLPSGWPRPTARRPATSRSRRRGRGMFCTRTREGGEDRGGGARRPASFCRARSPWRRGATPCQPAMTSPSARPRLPSLPPFPAPLPPVRPPSVDWAAANVWR